MKVGRLSKLILLASTIVAFIDITIAQESQQQTQLQSTNQNVDDTSLFREMENAIDEDSEQDDAYRILKSLQDVADEEEEDMEIDQDNDDEEEEEEEEEDDDFTPEFPEFQNEETTDFFEHLPQQPVDHAIDNQLNLADDTIDGDELTHPITEEEEEDDEEEEEINQVTTPLIPSFPNDNIPWQRPEPIVKADDNSKFYQDINFKHTEKVKIQPQSQGFKVWHILFIFMILVIVYRSSFKRRSHGMSELATSNTANPWGLNKDEKDYLPLHNGNKGSSRHYKSEIKNS